MFPFDAEALASSYALYNRAVWPAQAVALALALVLLWLIVPPRRGGGPLPALLLAAGWLWCGVVFFLRHFATLDFMAPVYGWAFVLQGLLLLWGLGWRRTVLRFRPDAVGWAAMALVAVALFGLPAISGLGAAGWESARIVGVAPGPTAAVTLALLLLAEGRVSWLLLAVPLLWCAVAGVTGWALDVPEALPLPAVGIAVLLLAVRRNWRSA